MRYIILVFVLVVLCSPVFAGDGVTTKNFSPPVSVEWEPAFCTYKPQMAIHPEMFYKSLRWELADSVSAHIVVPPGSTYSILADILDRSLAECSPEPYLTEPARNAIEHSPGWLRQDLTITFSRMNEIFQDMFAEVILEADSPYVDEIAFSVARMPAEILSCSYLSPGLLLENAEDIYYQASLLNYVELVEYEDYTTARYRIASDDDTSWVEIPRDIYYWYVVHPKITDETPMYLDRFVSLASDPFAGYNEPPFGAWWRSFLWSESDAGYSPLCEYLDTIDVLWAGLHNTIDGNGAVGAVTQFVQDVLEFDSGSERPHQPLRIYTLHMGRCGEHEDFTVAAARTALIPSRGAEAISTDHVWNEFYAGIGWHQWEPVNTYVDDYFVYEDGWGKVFASVYAPRSDGYTENVTYNYSHDTCDIKVYVLDGAGRRVDGADVILAAEYDDHLYFDTWGTTASSGVALFRLGAGVRMYGRVEHPIGSYPTSPSTVAPLLSGPGSDGRTYTRTMNISSGRMPYLYYTEAEPPDTAWGMMKLVVNYSVPYEKVLGTSFFDDVDGAMYIQRVDSGSIYLFALNETNYSLYLAGEPFEAYFAEPEADSGNFEFIFPREENIYLVLSNYSRMRTYETIDLDVKLYDGTSGIAEPPARRPEMVSISPGYPNPFNARTSFDYSIGGSSGRLRIYNLAGECVFHCNITEPVGRFTWDARDFPSGIYLVSVTDGKGFARSRVLLLK